MKRLKRFLAIGLALAMGAMTLSGCGSSSTGSTTSSSDSSTSSSSSSTTSSKKNPSDYKIGLVLSGSSKDGGWSQLAADALANAAKDYGCKTNFSENVATTDFETTISGYADQGYDIVVAHGAEFLNACKAVAAKYPNTLFVCNSALEGQAPNVAGIDYDGYKGGFLVGATMALASKTNKVGVVEASEEGASALWLKGTKDGAAYINKDCQVISINTGSWDDASKAKQAVDSLSSQGADVVSENCDAAGAGAVQECGTLGLLNVGWVGDFSKYGDACFVSFIQDVCYGTEVVMKKAMEGELKGQDNVYEIGAADGVVKMTEYTGKNANALTDEQKAKVKDLFDKACKGEDFSALK